MTLTLYTAHVLLLSTRLGLDEPGEAFATHAGLAVLLSAVWRARWRRGPLEAVVAQLARRARIAVDREVDRA
ncbi:hypothetical protein, partial [Salmonella sp. SAL4433]|uniref:hypothetical protein n=1 Tax=Salmonella sp. SAL4433 TaxID=3159888 RepID=UPI0039798C3D